MRMPRGLRERHAQIVEHGGEVARERVPSADQHIIMMGLHRHRIEPLHQFAKPAPDAIALGGVAVLFGDGEADPDRAAVVSVKALTVKALQDERGTIHPRAIGNGEEIRSLPQPIHDEIPKRGSGSGAQTLAAAGAAGGEHLSAAGRGETGTEAVTALAHQFAGLISPLHGFFSADRAICL
ncbi:hypothetical protein ABIB68_002102 [Bradyrhizobium sp. F1.2.2]